MLTCDVFIFILIASQLMVGYAYVGGVKVEEFLLEMKNISKKYGGIQALKDVTLQLKQGEVLCLCGENGAGKSTLMKILTGVETPTEGSVFFKGKEVQISKPIVAYDLGISIVHQELIQIPQMTIAENIYVGRYDKRNGVINYKELYAKTQRLMDRLGINFKPDSLIRQYSIAERQLIEILKALSYNSSVIVFDEPTAALTAEETQTLYKIIHKLKKEGVSVIFISHRMEDIYEVGDRVFVLKDGAFSGDAQIEDVEVDDIIRMMIGRDLEQQFVEKTNQPGETVLELKNITNERIKDVSFSVKSGEVLGIGGLIGAGRTEVLQSIYGVDSYDGEIIYKGEKIKNRTPKEAIKRGFALVPEDRKDGGLILSHSILQNVTLSVLKNISRLGIIKPRGDVEVALKYIEELRIKTPNASLKAGMLSGGNQQKVVLAKCLATNPGVLLLDEPTRGVDVGAKSEIYKIIDKLACLGYAIIMVSSELTELIAVSDRIIVMHEGKITGEVGRSEATEEKIMSLAISK